MKLFQKNTLSIKVFWTLVILSILLLGQAITIPGIDTAVAKVALEKQTYLQLLGIAVGGQFTIPSIFSLGLGPYMTSLILWQAITVLDLDSVNRLSLNQTGYIKKMITLVIAVLQAYPIFQYIQPALQPLYVNNETLPVYVVNIGIILILVAGAMLVVFLGNLNEEIGLGGISMMILPGVITGIPKILTNGWGNATYELTNFHIIMAIIVALFVILILVMLMQIELRIIVQKPLMEGSGSKSYLPFKLLIAGAMPFMFSSTVFMLPRNIVYRNYDLSKSAFGKFIMICTNQYTVWGIVTYGLIVILLTYIFGFITIQPFKLNKQMKENNEYIVGIFPGDDTGKYLLIRFFIMATIGGVALTIIAIIPLIIGLKIKSISNYTLYIGNIAILVGLVKVLWDQIKALYSKNRYRIFKEKFN